jgi:hypothetical protein
VTIFLKGQFNDGSIRDGQLFLDILNADERRNIAKSPNRQSKRSFYSASIFTNELNDVR